MKASLMAPLIVAIAAVTVAAAPSDADPFTAGSVGISTTPATKAITFHDMAPGDAATSPIAVRNVGSLDLRYALTIFATDPDRRSLASELELTIKAGVSDCSEAGFDVDGTKVYGPDRLGTVDGIVAWSGLTQGARGTTRTLETGDVDVLCIQVSLPASAGNEYQGAGTTASFRFDARPMAG